MEYFEYISLLIAALATSTLSGTIGMGGGILLLTFMAQFYNPSVLIPLHGVVQLASNTSRAYLLKEFIDWELIKKFVLGSALGGILGYFSSIRLPESITLFAIGTFILIFTWMPKLKKLSFEFKHKWTLLGGSASFLSLIVGATGPLLAPFFLNQKYTKEQIVATKAASQASVHIFKIFVFVAIGFNLSDHWKILLGMIPLVFLGSYLGKKLLFKFPGKWFVIVFKFLISLLTIRLFYKAWGML